MWASIDAFFFLHYFLTIPTFGKACFPLLCSGLFVLQDRLNKAFMLPISKVLLTIKYTFWRDFYLGLFCAFVVCRTRLALWSVKCNYILKRALSYLIQMSAMFLYLRKVNFSRILWKQIKKYFLSKLREYTNEVTKKKGCYTLAY